MKKEDLHMEIKEPDYYDSPLELVSAEEMIIKKIAEEFDNRCYAAITETTGIVIDKKKLEAALIQDKSRYQEAYQAGYAQALSDMPKVEQCEAEMMVEHTDGTVEYVKDIDSIMLLAHKDYHITYTGAF